MASSTTEHDGVTPPVRTKGHGTGALGPSDSSDTGSDIQGGPGLNRDDGLARPSGTTSDPDVDGIGATAGPDIGDANLDSDSDRYGTGERAAVGRDSTLPTDTVLRGEEDDSPIDGSSIGDDVDSDLPTADELVGSNAEAADIADDDDRNLPDTEAYRPAQAGQDASTVPASGTRTSREPREREFARGTAKTASGDDGIPLFDRSGRDDSIDRERGRH